MKNPSTSPHCHNRLGVLLRHTTKFAFEPQARLAKACNVSRSTISRIISGRSEPKLALAERIAEVLTEDLGVPIDVRDIFSHDGTYSQASGCKAAGCIHGCYPEEAYDSRGNLKPAYRRQKPGDWSLASNPQETV